jgi:hypothetical protein
MKSEFLILSLVIATIFTITLTETIQVSDGLLGSATKLIFELDVGEKQMLIWTLVNNEPDPIILELYATGPGSELLVFEQYVKVESYKTIEIQVIAIIPDGHLDNVEYHPELFALKRSASDGKQSGIAVNLQMKTLPFIKIGDNPVYTPPTIKEIEKSDEEKNIKVNTPPVETLDEMLARIQAANEANKSIETQTPTVNPSAPVVEKSVSSSVCGTGTVENAHGVCVPIKNVESKQKGGGCLIATATYGSELAPQVQFLRELRDNTLLSTDSGISFMTSFNQVYYYFSPSIADLERENPVFKQAVKLLLTPMLSTLSIMTLAEDGSESQVIGLGISVIALNLAMYLAAPAVIIHRLRK